METLEVLVALAFIGGIGLLIVWIVDRWENRP